MKSRVGGGGGDGSFVSIQHRGMEENAALPLRRGRVGICDKSHFPMTYPARKVGGMEENATLPLRGVGGLRKNQLYPYRKS